MPKRRKKTAPQSPKLRAKLKGQKGKKAAKQQAITLCPRKLALAKKYVQIRRGSKDKRFQWKKLDKNLTRAECSEIRKYVRQEKLMPEVKFVTGTKFPIFPPETVAAEIKLPPDMWKKGDKEQFDWLDKEYEKGMKEKPPKYKSKGDKAYTWHHHHEDGKMQLVEYGTHNSTKHDGGRTTWAKGGR
ncbi:MAG: HNH endonuclease [Acidobacteria bacterium]|nr:HNH endonuclease [Acidobacteriota bacterium]